MNRYQMIVLLCASAWSLWPLLMKKFNVPNSWGVTVVYIISLLMLLIPTVRKFSTWKHVEIENVNTVVIAAIIAGLLNGIAVYNYPTLFKAENAPVYIASVTTIMPIFALVFGYFLFSEPITIKQLIGLVVIVIGVVLINSK